MSLQLFELVPATPSREAAEALIAQDRDPEAEPSLRTALQLAPEDDALLSLMSIALTRMGHTQEALFYAREAARLSPGSADNHMILAVAQMETDPQAAETALKETLALDPLFEEALLLRSWMLTIAETTTTPPRRSPRTRPRPPTMRGHVSWSTPSS